MKARIVRDDSAAVITAVEGRIADFVRKRAHMVANTAKTLAPVKTANLVNSISAQPTDSPLVWKVVVAIHYAIFVELGTRLMQAKPFLIPAMLQHDGPFRRALHRLLRG